MIHEHRINLAKNCLTTQSSKCHVKGFEYSVDGANNGFKSGAFGFHTKREQRPWWQIDLGHEVAAAEICLYHREGFLERFFGAEIYVSLDGLQWEIILSKDGGCLSSVSLDKKSDLVWRFFLGGMKVRFIRVQHSGEGILHFDELEVFGEYVHKSAYKEQVWRPELTSKTYFKSKVTGGYVDKETILFLLRLIENYFKSTEAKCFLIYGSLLGAYRDNDIIPFDKDCDLALTADSEWHFYKCAMLLQSFGVEFVRDTGRLKSLMFCGHYVDFYIFSPVNKQYVCSKLSIDAFQFDNASEKISLCGVSFDRITDVERFLEEKYGHDWRVPIPGKHARE